jgi:hypothetical protein
MSERSFCFALGSQAGLWRVKSHQPINDAAYPDGVTIDDFDLPRLNMSRQRCGTEQRYQDEPK